MPVDNSAAAAAAAAARARAIAEAQRRAEEARERAEEAARKKAQEAAKKAAAQAKQKAEAARKKAQAANQKAEQKAHAAAEAKKAAKDAEAKAQKQQAELAAKQRALHNETRDATPAERTKMTNELDAEQKKVSAATSHAAQLQSHADAAQREAEKAHAEAIGAENHAITAEQQANETAKAAGEKQEFKVAGTVKNALDAGSLSAKDQSKLFGNRGVVSAREAAHQDALNVQEAAKKGPAQGAAELERQMKANEDPEYRSELMRDSQQSVDDIAHALGGKNENPKDAAAALKSLSGAAAMAGPEATTQLAQSLRDSAHDNGAGAEQRINAAISANSKDPATARIAVEMAKQYRADGDYDKADAIQKLSPDLAKTAAASTGEERARNDIKVGTVADDKQRQLDQVKGIKADAQKKIDAAYKLASEDKKKLPKDIEVQKNGDQVTILQKNKEGEVTQRIVAEKSGDVMHFEQTKYQNGQAQKSVEDANATGASTTQLSWKAAPSRNPGADPSLQQLENSTDPSVRVQRTAISPAGDNIQVQSFSKNAQGITDSTTTFGRQNGTDGINDHLDDKFDSNKPIDTESTRTVTIPAPDVKGPDGKPAKATVTQGASYSQDGVRASYQESKTADDIKGPPNTSQLSKAYDSVKDDLGDPGKAPKQWTLEVNKGPNRYDAQTFIEGHPEFTTITHREAKGSTVVESVESKGKDSDGNDYDAKQNTKTTYDELGRVAQKHIDATDPKGVHTVQDFSFQRKETKDGLQLTQTASTTRTEPGDPAKTWKEDQKQVSLMSENGPQLLSSNARIVDPEGDVTESNLDKAGMKTTVNGVEVKPEDVKKLPKDQQDSATAALASNLNNAKTFSGYGKQGLEIVRDGLKGALIAKSGMNKLDITQASDFDKAVQTYETMVGGGMSQAIRVASGVAGAGNAAVGALGVASSAASLVNDLQQGNIIGSVKDAVGLYTSGKAVKDGIGAVKLAKQFSTVEGGDKFLSDALASDTEEAAGLLGKFAETGLGKFVTKLGGVGAVLGVGLSGYQFGKTLFDPNADTVQKVQAGIGFGGAIAAVAIGAAVGGPLGAAVGAGIGLATIGVQAIAGLFEDKYRMADVKI